MVPSVRRHARPRLAVALLVATLAGLGFSPLALVGPLAARAAADGEALTVERGPRPLDLHERRGIELVLAYVGGGPDALLPLLAADGPLGGLDPAAARGELLARLGPSTGSTWTLRTAPHADGTVIFGVEFASGIEDTLVLTLDPTGPDGVSRLRNVTCLLDPRNPGETLPESLRHPERQAAAALPAIWPATTAATTASVVALAGAAALLLVALPAAGAGRRRHALMALLALAAAGGLCCRSSDTPTARTVVAPVRLAPLAELRLALAGTAPADTGVLVAALPAELELQGRVLQAAELIGRRDYERARALLVAMPTPSTVPMVPLLRGRLALFLGDSEAAALAYDEALALGPEHDGLHFEAAWAELLAGEPAGALIQVATAAGQGARAAEVYYLLASLEQGLDDNGEAAEAVLRTAWQLMPVERGRLFEDTYVATVAARSSIFPLFALGATEEPVVDATTPVAGATLELPALAQAHTIGSLLAVSLGATELQLPGAGRLAPAGTPALDGASERERSETRALGRFAQLIASGVDPATLATPHRQRQAEEIAAALDRRNRHDDVLRLTEGLTGKEAAPILIRQRARALLRADRPTEARDLLVEMAHREMALKRRDPGTLVDVAELCAETGQHELAARLLRKAQSISAQAVRPSRVRQIEAEAKLLADGQRVAGSSFDVVFPRSTGQRYPQHLVDVLEAERSRLRKFIPEGSRPPRIEVHLFNLGEFMNNYSADGVPVIGLYDGRVRVPFADLRSLHPMLVSILSHEVAHAMIDERTADRAPHWLQEGLAQHTEMNEEVRNPIPDLIESDRLLAFTVLEDVLTGFSEAQFVEIAYAQTAWFTHFLEQRHGVAKIHRLLDAFASGATTEEALERVYGKTPAELDRGFRAWATGDAPAAWKTAVRRYDEEVELAELKTVKEQAPVRVGASGTAPATAKAERESAVRAWHAAYAAKSTAVKGALGPVVRIFQGSAPGDRLRSSPPPTGGHEDSLAACNALGTSVAALRQDRSVARPPDDMIGIPFGQALDAMAKAAKACRDGHTTEVRHRLSEVEQALASFGRGLATYGLKP